MDIWLPGKRAKYIIPPMGAGKLYKTAIQHHATQQYTAIYT
ncbi:MAG TPA: hypothetical protein VIR02_13670 [Anaerolineales bacterium]